MCCASSPKALSVSDAWHSHDNQRSKQTAAAKVSHCACLIKNHKARPFTKVLPLCPHCPIPIHQSTYAGMLQSSSQSRTEHRTTLSYANRRSPHIRLASLRLDYFHDSRRRRRRRHSVHTLRDANAIWPFATYRKDDDDATTKTARMPSIRK